ncbi:MAG: NAD(P)-dependent oxidoreductase [Acidimicrobiales bacterium]
MTTIGFIGLGVMGYPMAGHLVGAGHAVNVYNRTTSVAERFVAEHPNASLSPTPAAAAASADIVFLIVGNDDSVRSVALAEDGALSAMQPGSILVDHTTASADIAVELGEAGAARGVPVIDAPVSGGEAGAQNGALTIMCGGDQDSFDVVEPVMAAYSSTRTLIGPLGSGQRTKMVNQVAIAGLVQGLSEALTLGMEAGLDMDRVLATISNGAAGSWQMSNRGHTMVADKFDFGFAIEWMVKDLGIALAEARRLGIDTPVADLVAGYYDELMDAGESRSDTSVLIRRLRQAD